MFQVYDIDQDWKRFSLCWFHPQIQYYLARRMRIFGQDTNQTFDLFKPLWRFTSTDYWQLLAQQKFHDLHGCTIEQAQRHVSKVFKNRNLPAQLMRSAKWNLHADQSYRPKPNTCGTLLCHGAANYLVDTLYLVAQLLFEGDDLVIWRPWSDSDVSDDYVVLNQSKELIIDIRLSFEQSQGLLSSAYLQQLDSAIWTIDADSRSQWIERSVQELQDEPAHVLSPRTRTRTRLNCKAELKHCLY